MKFTRKEKIIMAVIAIIAIPPILWFWFVMVMTIYGWDSIYGVGPT